LNFLSAVHTGDVFFNGTYPFFDASSGGAFRGMIAATERVLELTDESALVVPGHGALAGRDDVVAYRDMLVEVDRRVSRRIAAGETRAQIVASRPTKDFDPRWGQGFLKPESFVTLVYESLIREPGR